MLYNDEGRWIWRQTSTLTKQAFLGLLDVLVRQEAATQASVGEQLDTMCLAVRQHAVERAAIQQGQLHLLTPTYHTTPCQCNNDD